MSRTYASLLLLLYAVKCSYLVIDTHHHQWDLSFIQNWCQKATRWESGHQHMFGRSGTPFCIKQTKQCCFYWFLARLGHLVSGVSSLVIVLTLFLIPLHHNFHFISCQTTHIQYSLPFILDIVYSDGLAFLLSNSSSSCFRVRTLGCAIYVNR